MKPEQMQDNKVDYIQLSNGKSAALILPSLENEKLAVIDLEVLKRITSRLNKVNLNSIKEVLIHNIEGSQDLNDILFHLDNELRFHRSVNLINTIQL